MALDSIREFMMLAETGNFTEAAERLFISQSTLSRHIRAFESELGVQLFTRSAKTVTLNEFGQRFFPYARRVLDAEAECIRSFRDEVRKISGQLKVGVFVLDEQYPFTEQLFAFRRQHPEYEISIVENNAPTLREFVRNGTCNFAIIANGPETDAEDLEHLTIFRDSLVAVVPQNHPLAGAGPVEPARLKDTPVILRDASSAYYRLYQNAAQQAGFVPTISLQNLTTKSIVKMVELGYGITLRPKQLCMNRRNTTTKIVDITPPIALDIDLIYCTSQPRTASENALIAFFRNG